MKAFKISDYLVEPENKIAKRMIYKDSNVIAFVLNIAKGQTLPNHSHFQCTVLIEVLAGKANLNVGEETIPIEKGGLVQLDGPELMSVDNTGDETLALYVTISPEPDYEEYSVDLDI